MSRKRRQLDHMNEADEVASLLVKEKTSWKKERLQALNLLLGSDRTFAETASAVGRSPAWVKSMAKLFREGGLQALLVRGNGGGRKPKMSAEIQEKLAEELRVGRFRTAGQIENWLKEEHQLQYAPGSIYYVFAKARRALESAPSQPPEKG